MISIFPKLGTRICMKKSCLTIQRQFLSSKMYQVDSSKFTSKPDPKKEFAHYFKNSGAAAALQKAMILLYRMPVKPENMVEYFSEYFEDGAQRLMRISLLKAELCYKKDELEKYNEKVKASEGCIQGLVDQLGISEKDFNERFMPPEIPENDRLIILERYFKDMERESENFAEAQLSIDDLSVAGDDAKMESENDLYDKEDDLSGPTTTNPYDVDLEVMKKLDPWGIICGVPAIQQVKKSQAKYGKSKISTVETIRLPTIQPIKSELSVLMTQAQLEKEVNGNGELDSEAVDDDDGATLADVFQQFAFDSAHLNQDEGMVRLHNQLLTVKKADSVKLSDLMGWNRHQSREDVRASRQSLTGLQSETDKETSATTPEEEEAANFLTKPFDEDFSDIDKLRQNPCQQQVLSARETNAEETDAFLFEDTDADDVIANAHGMMEAEQDFVFEFPEHSRRSVKHERGVCKPVDSTAQYQTCSRPTTGDFLQGKMADWAYSGISKEVDGDELDEEAEKWQRVRNSFHQSNGTNPNYGDVPIMRVDSSCHCILASSYSASELYEGTEKNHKKESIDGDPKTKRRSFGLEVEATIVEDAALAKELDEVFKKNRRSSSVKGGSKNKKHEEIDDQVQDNVVSGIYGVVDLAKEIRRTIIGPDS